MSFIKLKNRSCHSGAGYLKVEYSVNDKSVVLVDIEGIHDNLLTSESIN